MQVNLWLARHTKSYLESIRNILGEHPGETPVEIHLQSGTGKRATVQAGENFRVNKSAALDKALAKWTEGMSPQAYRGVYCTTSCMP